MEENYIIDRNFIEEVLNGTSSIDHSENIEDALIVIKAAQNKIEFLKRLKQKRINPISEAIKTQEERVEKLKSAITNFMVKNKEKTIDFPDFSKITVKKTKGTWVIDDDLKLTDHLKSLNKFEEVGEEIVSFNKSKLNKVLDELEKNNNTSEYVHREEEKDTLSISFVKNNDSMTESIDDMLPQEKSHNSIPSNTRLIPARNMDISDLSHKQSKPENINDLSF